MYLSRAVRGRWGAWGARCSGWAPGAGRAPLVLEGGYAPAGHSGQLARRQLDRSSSRHLGEREVGRKWWRGWDSERMKRKKEGEVKEKKNKPNTNKNMPLSPVSLWSYQLVRMHSDQRGPNNRSTRVLCEFISRGRCGRTCFIYIFVRVFLRFPCTLLSWKEKEEWTVNVCKPRGHLVPVYNTEYWETERH